MGSSPDAAEPAAPVAAPEEELTDEFLADSRATRLSPSKSPVCGFHEVFRKYIVGNGCDHQDERDVYLVACVVLFALPRVFEYNEWYHS